MNIRTLVVDDEPLARERVRTLLAPQMAIELVGECGGGAEALQTMQDSPIELLFLDVQMPEIDGFEVLRRLPPEQRPVVVFTTAYDAHALRAFEAQALDYLLKPYKVERFQAASARAIEQVQQRRLGLAARGLWQASEPTAALKRLTVRDGDSTVVVPVDDIEYIEAAGNYACLVVNGRTHVLRETLSALESQLNQRSFVRIGRGVIVNIACVIEVRVSPQSVKGGYVVLMRSGKKLPMTRALKEVEDLLRYR
jgi:two-component system, LytTR family, response regulator